MVAHAQLAVAERAHRPLGARRSAPASAGSTGVPYGMREARQGLAAFSALGTASAARQRPHVRLRRAGLEQRVHDAVLVGRRQARAASRRVSSAFAPDSTAA